MSTPSAPIPGLDPGAVAGGRRRLGVIAHVVCSRAWVGEDAVPCSASARSVCFPSGKGKGSAPPWSRTDRVATARREPLIALLGNPAYYGRFGFVRSTDHGIDPADPAWGEHFQVLPLADHDPTVTGTFRYAPAFD